MFIRHVRFLKASSTFLNASNSGETYFGEHNYITFLFTLTWPWVHVSLPLYRRSKVGGMGFLKLISQAFPRPLPQSPLVFVSRSFARFIFRSRSTIWTSGTGYFFGKLLHEFCYCFPILMSSTVSYVIVRFYAILLRSKQQVRYWLQVR